MIGLIAHYRIMFAYLGLASILIIGIIIGIIVALAALRAYARRSADEELITELKALQHAHNEDLRRLSDMTGRLQGYKESMAVIKVHIGAAMTELR